MSSHSPRPAADSPQGFGKKASSQAQTSHEIRLIGGQWKRSKLQVPNLPHLRPTPNRVRETLFNWLGQDLTGLRCLDAFAGTGALGLEAASRGASEVLLLEQQTLLVQAMRRTITRLTANHPTAVSIRAESADALALMRTMPPERWDVIFLDPPFLDGQNEALFHSVLRHARHCIGATGWLHLEAPRVWNADELSDLGWHIWRMGKAGAVHHYLLQPSTQS